MLRRADEALIRRETAMPGLRTLLDEAAFLSVIRRLNPRVEIASARLRYLRYKPGTNCLADYEVKAQGATWRVHGKTWRPGETDPAAAKGMQDEVDRGIPVKGGPVAEASCLVRVFPSDAKLRALRFWSNATERRQFMEGREALVSFAGATGWKTLNYKPERRLVGRLEWPDGRPAAVVKTHAPSGFEAAYAVAKAIRSGSRYEVPRYVGKARRHSTLVYAWQDGVALESMLAREEANPRMVEAVGAGLAELHRMPNVNGLGETRVDHEAAGLAEHGAMLGWLVPELGVEAGELARRLAAGLATLGRNDAVVHGDFYAKQVLWRQGTVVFLDFDEARRGLACLDVANFLAHLEMETLAGRLSSTTARMSAEAMVAGYEAAAGVALPGAMPVVVASRLFVQACHCFRRREANWEELLTRVLERVRELAATASCGGTSASRFLVPMREVAPPSHPDSWSTSVTASSSVVPGTFGRVGASPELDPALPFLGRAMDVVWMDHRLRQLEAKATTELRDRRLTEATMLRHKPGRRCVIEYRFGRGDGSTDLKWLGKARSRRGTPWSTRVAGALREAGLDENGDVSVPEPLGEVPEIHMELQRHVKGRPVFDELGALTCAGGVGRLARRCAEAIHRMHQSRVTVERRHTLADELRILRERLDRMRGTHASLGDRLSALLRGCERQASSLSEGEGSLIHRDYYADQILVDGARLWILDLDLCAMGDPCLDHGNFIAHLVDWSFRRLGRRDPERSGEAAYREAALTRLDRGAAERLETCVTLSLARLVPIATQFPDRQPWIPALLELCEERLRH